jgi:hypothetical protein
VEKRERQMVMGKKEESFGSVRGSGLATDFSTASVSQPVARFVRRLSE